MILKRNTAGQVFVIPGSLRSTVDGSGVSSATIRICKDGSWAAGAGTLTHDAEGVFTYAPTQGETDCQLMGYSVAGTDAMNLAGTIRTTNGDLNDGTRLGLTALPNANAAANGGLPTVDASNRVKADLDTIKTQTVTAAAGVTFPASIGTGTSTYDGSDTSGTTTLLSRLTSGRAGNLDNLDAAVSDIPTNAELATAIVTGLTTAMAEGYRGTRATGSVRDLLYEIRAQLGENEIVGATKTAKKIDGSTTAKTYTLNDPTTPTGITEAT